MFICRRLLQLGVMSALLAGVPPPLLRPLVLRAGRVRRQRGTCRPIRIGPTAPGPETADEGPAALTPSGGLKPEVRQFLEGLSAERKLPLAPWSPPWKARATPPWPA